MPITPKSQSEREAYLATIVYNRIMWSLEQSPNKESLSVIIRPNDIVIYRINSEKSIKIPCFQT
jgi:hypothetical protein